MIILDFSKLLLQGQDAKVSVLPLERDPEQRCREEVNKVLNRNKYAQHTSKLLFWLVLVLLSSWQHSERRQQHVIGLGQLEWGSRREARMLVERMPLTAIISLQMRKNNLPRDWVQRKKSSSVSFSEQFIQNI